MTPLESRLARALEPGARVYAFGASGAPLSQYLAYAAWAAEKYAPSRMVFLIIGNDFDESLLKYKAAPGYHYFSEDEEEGLSLVRMDYVPSVQSKLVLHSSLLRYLMINLQVQRTLMDLLQSGRAQSHRYVGNTEAQADAERVADSQAAVRAFLEQLPGACGLPPSDILLTVDGLRPELYEPVLPAQACGSFFGQMRGYFLGRAARAGFHTIDLQPLQREAYANTGQRLEYPRDGHWNGWGHQVFAEAVLASGFLDAYRTSLTTLPVE